MNINHFTWANERVSYWWEKSCNLNFMGARLLLPKMPKLDFSSRMKTTAGVARTDFRGECIIRLNTDLLIQQGSNFDATIGHEVAHIFTNLLYGRGCGHGSEWAEVMVKLGLTPSRCHQYATDYQRQSHQRFVCKCPHCQVDLKLTQNLITRIRRGSVRICLKCRGRITAQNMGF